MFHIFQNQRTRSFADDKAVSVFVERFRRRFGRFVEDARSAERIENRRVGRRKFFRSACDHDFRPAVFDRFVRITDRLTSGRTRGIGHDDTPADLIVDAQITRVRLRHRFDIGLRIELRRVARPHHIGDIHDRIHTSHARAVCNAGAAAFQFVDDVAVVF